MKDYKPKVTWKDGNKEEGVIYTFMFETSIPPGVLLSVLVDATSEEEARETLCKMLKKEARSQDAESYGKWLSITGGGNTVDLYLEISPDHEWTFKEMYEALI